MRVRALGREMTFYDDDGNVIQHVTDKIIDNPDEECKVINIVDFEDRLMGIDPDEKPDFFIDLENDERFKDLDLIEYRLPEKNLDFDAVLHAGYLFVIFISALIIGYKFGQFLMGHFM